MGRDADGNYTPGWTPPRFTVDDNGKVVDYVNGRAPNNWGRWGDLDERGTVNFITPERVAEAASLIRTGEVISCAIPLDSTGPVHPARTNITHFFSLTGADFVAGTMMSELYPKLQGTDDYLIMPTQGSTQWDGLSHIGFGDTFYNGYWVGNVEQFAGAKRLGMHNMKDRLVGRGVLLDMARHKGVPRLEQGYAITADDLDGCIEAEGVAVRTGDILIVRTGHVSWWYELQDKAQFWAGAPGMSIKTVDWLHEKEIAALAMDNIAIEVEPFEEPVEHYYPMHSRLIRDLGLSLGEIWHLEQLAEACAADGRYEFFLAAQPLNITNGSGTPINPIAIK
jgi:kynurenine formamidase